MATKQELPAELLEELETLKSITEQETEVNASPDGTILVSIELPKQNENETSHRITFILSSKSGLHLGTQCIAKKSPDFKLVKVWTFVLFVSDRMNLRTFAKASWSPVVSK